MKKLMIAAAAVAMVGGAFAAEADGYAAVYNLKYSLKTIQPKKFSCGKDDTTCTICTTIVQTASSAYYYENGSATIEGLIAYCDPCADVGENYRKAVLALWDSKNKQTIYFDNSWKNAQTVYQVLNSPVSNVFSKIDTVVYGKNSTKAAMDTKLQYAKFRDAYRGLPNTVSLENVRFVWDLRAAGLGSYAWSDLNQGYVKSVNGNVAGIIPAFTGFGKPFAGYYWSGLVVDDICWGAVKFACKDKAVDLTVRLNSATPMWDWKEEINDKDVRGVEKAYVVPAYGTWTMKYNKSAVYNKNGLKAALPSWLR